MTENWLRRFKRQEFNGTMHNAMFKGVSFIIQTAESDFGRRTVKHEFPQRDLPYTEDLGRKARAFTIEGRLVGADYLTQRDELWRVCEEPGPGELIHPYYGNLNVICRSINFRDNTREARTVLFQAVFVETGELVFPIETVDTTSQVENKAIVSLDSMKSPFEKLYGIVSLPLVYAEGKLETLDMAFDIINKAKQITGLPAEFNRQMQAARASSSYLILSAGGLFDTLYDLITFGLLDDPDELDARESYQGLREVKDFESTTRKDSVDSEAIENLVQSLNVATMGLLLSRIDYESKDEAEFFQNDVFDKINELIELGVLDDEVIQNMKDLREAIVEDIENRSGTLAQLTKYVLPQTLPALVLSYQLYGNIEEEENIINRNRIEHPGLVPGGQEVEVLLDV